MAAEESRYPAMEAGPSEKSQAKSESVLCPNLTENIE